MTAASGNSRWGVGLATALVWALAGGGALYWGLRAGQPPAPSLPPAVGDAGLAVDAQAVAHALGVPRSAGQDASQPQSAIASRVRLSGVVTHGAGGAALLSVDGKPPKPYRVGATVDGGWIVQAVLPHAVELADGAQHASIEMPPLTARTNTSSAADTGQPVSAPPPPLVTAPIAAPPLMQRKR
ncbi:MAG: general secretion pathway protein C [Burkholderiaceae bacterium]|jgi:general secretion pathway protein C|nr:general secretion pathway protein C [Burkholderiaceae bacterium]